MADKSQIEWTEATWNPIAGCSVVSPGCTNCYAMRRVAPRLSANPATPHYAGTVQASKSGPVWTGKIGIAADSVLLKPLSWRPPRMIFVNSTSDLFHESVPDEVIDRIFAVMALCPQHTFQVLTKRAKRMRKYMLERWQPAPAQHLRLGTDVHLLPAETEGEDRADQVRREAEDLINDHAPLRSRLADLENESHWTTDGDLKATSFAWPLPNVWLGVSVEDQTRADERIPELLATPAAVRFISAEPLLGPIDLRNLRRCTECGNTPHQLWERDPLADPTKPWLGNRCPLHYVEDSCDGTLKGVDWVIVGGESGDGARPMHPEWARSLRDQCAAASVPFFFKQWGEWAPGILVDEAWGSERPHVAWPDGTIQWGKAAERGGPGTMMNVAGKHAAGRLLDGVEHNGMPGART